MAKLFSVLASLFIAGFAHAAEIADAPIPEDNYAGIIIFLVLMVGSGVWFMWKVMAGGNKAKEQDKK